MTPEQLLNELDNRFDLLIKNNAKNIDALNKVSKSKLQVITINRKEYEEIFIKDELISIALERVIQLGRAVGMFIH